MNSATIEQLIEKLIEELRQELHLLAQNDKMTEKKVIEQSQQLDELLNLYFKYKSKK